MFRCWMRCCGRSAVCVSSERVGFRDFNKGAGTLRSLHPPVECACVDGPNSPVSPCPPRPVNAVNAVNAVFLGPLWIVINMLFFPWDV